jgi:hypothetical protein
MITEETWKKVPPKIKALAGRVLDRLIRYVGACRIRISTVRYLVY